MDGEPAMTFPSFLVVALCKYIYFAGAGEDGDAAGRGIGGGRATGGGVAGVGGSPPPARPANCCRQAFSLPLSGQAFCGISFCWLLPRCCCNAGCSPPPRLFLLSILLA